MYTCARVRMRVRVCFTARFLARAHALTYIKKRKYQAVEMYAMHAHIFA